MAKVNVSSVVPGQVGDIQRESAAAAAEQATRKGGRLESRLQASPAAPSAPPAASTAEEVALAGLEQSRLSEEQIALDEQRERERVAPISERQFHQDDANVYDYAGKRAADAATAAANSGPNANGGMFARAINMAEMVTNENLGLKIGAAEAVTPVLENIGAISEVTGKKNLDYDFAKVVSVVTENGFADLAFNEGVKEDVTPTDNVTAEEATGRPINKIQGSVNIGKQINRDWQRLKNAREGRPTDEYKDISNEEAAILGDAAKELYYEANKNPTGGAFMTRGKTNDGKVVFTLTKHGADRIKQGSQMRKRLFPKKHIRPSKTPLPGGTYVGEAQVYTRKVRGKSGKTPANQETIREATRNLAHVPNVVDPQRLKILLATVLPVLSGEVDIDHPFRTMNGVGKDKFDEFVAKQKLTGKISAEEEYGKIVDNLAQYVFGIAQDAEGANYLNYYIQSFTGRIAPDQTLFDPTSSKAVRFVTRNAVPAKASPGSRVERNLRQMYAMMLVKGADAALPDVRERMLANATPKLVKWGKELQSVLGQISNDQVKKAAEAIKGGVAVTDPNFPKLPVLEISDPELVEAIQSKGEDGPAFVDGLMDFYDYEKARINKQPHFSYFNAYMDGKTNGLASNGIQMGSENVARRTGVIRSQDELLLDEGKDIRDELKDILLDSVSQGFDGDTDKFNGALDLIARTVFSSRDLNKYTTMTYGYGKDADTFIDAIDERLGIMAENTKDFPELQPAIDLATSKVDRQVLLETLADKYTLGLEQALDDDALATRGIMRSAALLHALTNELFSIRSPTGFELNLGGTLLEEWQETGKYHLYTNEGEAKSKIAVRAVGHAEARPTSASAKRYYNPDTEEVTEDPGGIAYGGSVVAPVQSIDAATVAKTASGRSWARLKNASNGNPYLHTIYDAFKVDAMGYDVVLDEVNKNWLNAGMDWSYLEETQLAMDALREKWHEKTKGIPNDAIVPDNDWLMAGYLLEKGENLKGDPSPSTLIRKLSRTLEYPGDAPAAAWRIVKGMRKVGYDFANPPPRANYGQLRTFIKLFSNEIELQPRLGSMIRKTNKKKDALRKEIRKSGPVLQYYSH